MLPQIIGALLAMASCVWLVAQFIAPRGMTGLEATAVFLPTALIGLAMVWFGHRRIQRLRTSRRALRGLLDGHRSTALLYVAAKLGLADLLANGPRSSAELAQVLGAHAPSLHRILRGLAALGVCSEEHDGRFGLTGLGKHLQASARGSLRSLAILSGEERAAAWGGLVHSAMTGETAFNRVFGMSEWEHRERHPELNECFNESLTESTARTAGAILRAYDFAAFHTIADVGGGHGALLAAILEAHPSVTGILFDQPHVVAGAGPCLEAAGVHARCQIVGGDLFDRIPDGADLHILKSIIHDWDDEHALAILRNCHKALKESGKVLLVEQLLPARAEQDPDAILLDVQMLALTGGQERSKAEYRALLAAAGFRLTRVIPTWSRFRVIEGVRAGAVQRRTAMSPP
jgi:SAM-dependent methyltransferase